MFFFFNATATTEIYTLSLHDALPICLILAGCLFVMQIYVASLLSPYDSEYLRNHPELQGKAYYHIVNQEINLWLGWALSLMKAIGASFAAMVGQAAASRLLFSMGRDKRLPPFFAKVSQKSGVPTMAKIGRASCRERV